MSYLIGYPAVCLLVAIAHLGAYLDRRIYDVPKHWPYLRFLKVFEHGGHELIPPEELAQWWGPWPVPDRSDSIERYYVHKVRNVCGVLMQLPDSREIGKLRGC